ncbi:3-oxoacyl-acyl-carrier protein reductase, putative [Entamoeba invadens IP1]|uniref:3-oxoacyl-acyl-carrier protein reductase, putative n=1 Tax=Entamoeba invadens IP1 TaxID=370355 RepID=A0A0A1U8S1_ENTIV|nr:3-oxoacyl-acyl-carrier protein reductase, putative [Entamoeba invadens IP1]ELP89488.1 3-oxoacyl-acyl-carrier protein reductase, putative [Entamoeba invadens IP1]|eukprot:XP_004256259.1 3-oxoacyl-acyl-carrier protein reductase, putative [Entamoeba invadens IP1]
MFSSNRVWLVTGTSLGFGKAYIEVLLSKGYNVAATTRTKAIIEAEFGKESEHFLPLNLNVKNKEDVVRVVSEVKLKFGRIDCLINNAGYALVGFVEEVDE